VEWVIVIVYEVDRLAHEGLLECDKNKMIVPEGHGHSSILHCPGKEIRTDRIWYYTSCAVNFVDKKGMHL
jgi:hypothetical protein